MRQVLFRESRFRTVLTFSIASTIQLGVATLFLNQSEAAIVEMTVVAVSILWIGRSYVTVGRVYANPGEALRLGEQALIEDLHTSMREAEGWAASQASAAAAAAFESSLEALRDNVVMAIERRELGVVKDGLNVYSKLISEILEAESRLQAPAGTSAGAELHPGRQLNQIHRDLLDVIDGVSASPSRRLWVDSMSWMRRTAKSCADRRALGALHVVLDLFEKAWEQELAAPSADTSRRQDILLFHLSAIGQSSVHRSLGKTEIERTLDAIYTKSFLGVVKQAIDSNDVETTKSSIKYFMHGSIGTALTPATSTGLLALKGWILYRFNHDNQDSSFKDVCHQIDIALRKEKLIPLLREARNLSGDLGYERWEDTERGPTSTILLEIDLYISLAVILTGSLRLESNPLDSARIEDINITNRLLTTIQYFESEGFSVARTALGVPDTHFDNLKEVLHATRKLGGMRSQEQSRTIAP